MKKVIEIKNDKPNSLRITYDLGNICNYKCWYCFPGANEGTTRWPNVDVVKQNMVNVINYYYDNNITDIQLTLIGGEPTLWPDFGEFVEYVATHSKSVKISAHTNGSRTLRWWREYGQYFDHVYLSIHHERVDLDHIVEVAEILLDKKVAVSAAVLMDHTNWDKCMDNLNYLLSSKRQFIVYAKPIYIDGKTTYNTEQLSFLETDMKRGPSEEDKLWMLPKFSNIPVNTIFFDDGTSMNTSADHWLMMNDLNHFKGWKCSLGINSISILRDGRITGFCEAKLFGMNDYYNLNDFHLDFKPKLQTVICHKDDCVNSIEALLNKHV